MLRYRFANPGRAPDRRRGAILMVVVMLLALFAVVGISFVLFAESEATASKLYLESERSPGGKKGTHPKDIADAIFQMALGDIIYDVPDNEYGPRGVHSAIRGHSLARNIYGYNYVPGTAVGTAPAPLNGLNNDLPFNGLGVPRGQQRPVVGPTATDFLPMPAGYGGAVDDYPLLNYTLFREMRANTPQNWLRDPERLASRNVNRDNTGYVTNPANDESLRETSVRDVSTLTANTTRPYVGINAPYTYPDRNSLFLAAVRPYDGKVLEMSYHRKAFFNPTQTFWDTTTPANRSLNWTNDEGKYYILRSRKKEHTADFPDPADNFGDVKNLPGKVADSDPNDSIWLDLDLPVFQFGTTKYKAMVACLIIDLDGKVNVQVAGNVRNSGVHASSQGLGASEVNASKLLAVSSPEYAQLFTGTPATPGPRVEGKWAQVGPTNFVPLGPAGQPVYENVKPGKHYSRLDLDANGAGQLTMPSGATAFPDFPTPTPPSTAERFGDGSGDERNNSQLLHNPTYAAFDAVAKPRRLPVADMQKLLQEYQSPPKLAEADLGKLWKLGLSDLLPLPIPGYATPPSYGSLRRWSLTTHSYDLDRPGLMPWVTDRAAGSGYAYDTATRRATATAIVDINLGAALGTASDFTANTYRGVAAALQAIDLNRKLTSYYAVAAPANPDAVDDSTYDATQYGQAITDRQQFAADIYARLCVAVGVTVDVANNDAAHKWLAQVAVNVVDQTDGDDIMTPFFFKHANGGPAANDNQVVFGTELPRIAINEAYAQINNNLEDDLGKPATPRKAKKNYQANFWVELHNPHKADPNLTNNGGARLTHPAATDAIYQVQVAHTLNAAALRDQNLGNPTGDATSAGAQVVVQTKTIADELVPAGGHYVFGPKYEKTTHDEDKTTGAQPGKDGSEVPANTRPSSTTTSAGPSNTAFGYELDYNAATWNTELDKSFCVILRRLAQPALPLQTDPNAAAYNPYVTVDFVDGVRLHDVVTHDKDGPRTAAHVQGTNRKSHGKRHIFESRFPFSDAGNVAARTPNNAIYAQGGGTADKPATTLTGPNTNLANPLPWLVHLDRPFLSPVEMMYTSTFPPHELTQEFVHGADAAAETAPTFAAAKKHNQRDAWEDENTRLFRSLELLKARNRTAMSAFGGRTEGKININTIQPYDASDPIVQALIDANGANLFTPNVAEQFMRLLRTRSPNVYTFDTTTNTYKAQLNGTLGLADGPVLPLGTAATAGGAFPALGLQRTLLQRDATQGTDPNALEPGDPRSLQSDNGENPNPYVRYELLNKIADQITTRSNSFAVWMTVGFFEVVDDTSKPHKLGKEYIPDASGQPVRKKYFAIVDRTNLSIDSADPTQQGPRPDTFAATFVTGSTAVPNPADPASDPNPPLPFVMAGAASAFVHMPTAVTTTSSNTMDGFTDGRPWAGTNSSNVTATGLKANDLMRLGTAPTFEDVKITAVNTLTGVVTIQPTTGAPFARTHYTGTVLTTARAGNPGPQPNFNPFAEPYDAVVPFVYKFD